MAPSPHQPRRRSLEKQVDDFLADLAHANRSSNTCRAYGADLSQFTAFHNGSIRQVTPEVLRRFWSTLSHLGPASRARKQAAVASFLTWAYRHDLITSNPMAKIDRVKRNPSTPRAVELALVEKILSGIPRDQRRDRLLFRLVFETGIRIGEALGIHVEDLDLSTDDEHVTVLGKGDKPRTVLLDDARLVRQLRSFLKQTGYRHGPLFRAQKNGRGGPLRYQSVQEHWARYCQKTGAQCTLHQLRHTHATLLINGGVSLATIRKQLGHKNLQTTMLYAEQSDATADAELRQWRRKQSRRA